MDWHAVAELLLGLVIAISGFVMKRLFERVDKLEDKVQEHALFDANHYAQKTDLKEFETSIFTKIDMILGKIDALKETVLTANHKQ